MDMEIIDGVSYWRSEDLCMKFGYVPARIEEKPSKTHAFVSEWYECNNRATKAYQARSSIPVIEEMA